MRFFVLNLLVMVISMGMSAHNIIDSRDYGMDSTINCTPVVLNMTSDAIEIGAINVAPGVYHFTNHIDVRVVRSINNPTPLCSICFGNKMR